MATVNRIGIAQATGEIVYRDISVNVAPKAECDENGKRITNYITSIEKNSSNLIIKNGRNETSTIGLAMTGATSTSSGAPGFVPQPTSNDRTKVLSGAGTWINTVKSVTLNGNYLNVDGTNLTIPYAGNGISNITRSGTTFTVTRANGSTFTFNQQDTNTTYSAGTGLSLNGTQFNNTGVISASLRLMPGSGLLRYTQNDNITDIDLTGIRMDKALTLETQNPHAAGTYSTYISHNGSHVIINNLNGFTLTFQNDGNLLLHRTSDGALLFDAVTVNKTFKAQGWASGWTLWS